MIRKLGLLTALTIALLSILGVALNVQRVEADGTIYIRADGSIDPSDAPISTVHNVTYTLTDNIFNDSIVVLRNNIVLDGAGYTVQGTEIDYSIGIRLSMISNVTIKNLEIREFWTGISLDYSKNNTVTGNTIRDNDVGVELWGDCANNTFYRNNFIDNTIQVDATMSYFVNYWDILPPIGNYWSDYEERYPDAEEIFGLWDTPYVIDANNVDHLPERGMVYELCCPWGVCFWVSSSSLLSYELMDVCGSIRFNVTGEDGTDGFCRVAIPHDVLEPPYTVTVNYNPATPIIVFENETLSIIYFNYTHSTKEVEIVPEFPSFIIPPLFMIATLAAVIIFKRKYVKDGK